MPKKKTSKTNSAPAVDRAAPCSAFVIFAESLRKMAGFYNEHPSPGHIRPVDAIQMALCDAAGAAEYAAQCKQWVKPGVWEKPNTKLSDAPRSE